MATLKTRYVTVDDVQTEKGIDLRAELNDDANSSDKAERFIKTIEDRIETYIASHFYRNVRREFACFSDFQKEHFKKAILEQIEYVLENGDLGTLSGIEDGREIANRKTYEKIVISPYARDELRVCGLWCRKVKNVGRGFVYVDRLY